MIEESSPSMKNAPAITSGTMRDNGAVEALSLSDSGSIARAMCEQSYRVKTSKRPMPLAYEASARQNRVSVHTRTERTVGRRRDRGNCGQQYRGAAYLHPY